MDPRVEVPRVVTPVIATRLQLSQSRMRAELRRGNWRRICRGALLTRPEEPTRADLAAVGIWLAGRTGALSGWDALRTIGLGGRFTPDAPVLVLSSECDNRSVDGLVVRRTSRPYRRALSATAGPYPLTPIVHAARGVADAALAYQSLEPVRALVTSAVQRRRCLPVELVAEYRSGPRGESLFFRLALEDVLDGARSIAEATAARKLTRRGIPPFELNVEFADVTGVVFASPDIYWRELRAVMEVDGREYHFSEQDWKKTTARHNKLTRLGYSVIHHPPSVINSRDESWIDEVQQWLAARAIELGVLTPPGRGPRRQHPLIN